MAMTVITLTTLIIVTMICLPADATRTLPFSSRPLLAADDNGICKLMVETQGYVCEEHMVTTKDGYILSIQRIPVGRSDKKPDKPPVLLQHGIISDAAAWVSNSPNKSLAFILADNGFDVWLANTRGTEYSRGHTRLNISYNEYWEWSWDELAADDLPAFVQYVHDQTGQKLHYVGHSLGTLMALAALSQEKLLDMVRSAGLLCPIAYMRNVTAQPLKDTADNFVAEFLYYILGSREFNISVFFPEADAVGKLVEDICELTHSNCTNLMAAYTVIRNGTIAMFDYGSVAENNKHYGQSTPPLYDMASIPNNFPIFMGYGGQDEIADVQDVHKLLDSLKDHDADNLVHVYVKEYRHDDFVFAANAKQKVYDHLMAFFNKLQENIFMSYDTTTVASTSAASRPQ